MIYMVGSKHISNWGEINGDQSRRRLLLKKIEKHFKNSDFRKSDLNRYLNTDTTTKTLNNICDEDGYLKKTQQGGNGLWLKYDPTESDTKFAKVGEPADLFGVAEKIIREKNLPIDADDYNWEKLGQVNKFCSDVNDMFSRDDLVEIVGTSNHYKLRDEAFEIIKKHISQKN